MKCPICGGAELKHETRDVKYGYKGHITMITKVTGDYCDACGEIIFDRLNGELYSKQVAAFVRKVNADEVDPNFIATIRKRFNLDQRQAAEIFGGGANAFSRYETGRVAPPKPLVLLFKALDKHPELFEELKHA
ncbi:type II TA system antitoxin MqsA family protein [Kosakonia sp. BYX6]|uniref:Type II TA system antitoxin MqsA family protein n=1 Tax=Kosakonia calanthes TaxID=3139408 RepID=A0ABZ3B4V7_9ENTR